MTYERYAVAGDYPIRFRAKAPGETLDYVLDFVALSVGMLPASLLGVAWSVVALPGDSKPLAIVAQSMALGLSAVRLTGGSPLSEYSVRGQCSWSDGETSVVSFALPISFLPNSATLFPSSVVSAELFGLPSVH